MINRGKRSHTLSEVKPFEIISKNLQNFLDISPVQKEVFLSHKLQDHAYEQKNLLELKEDNPSKDKFPESIESSKFASEGAGWGGGGMSGEFDSRKDSHSTKLEQRPQIFVKLSFRELCCSSF